MIFDLPEGFDHGELLWPAPVFFEQPGGIAGFGYEDSVVLATEITTPDRMPSSVFATLKASWLACKDVCILGSAELKAELPLSGDELRVSKAAFESLAVRYPRPVPLTLWCG